MASSKFSLSEFLLLLKEIYFGFNLYFHKFCSCLQVTYLTSISLFHFFKQCIFSQDIIKSKEYVSLTTKFSHKLFIFSDICNFMFTLIIYHNNFIYRSQKTPCLIKGLLKVMFYSDKFY